MKIYKLLGESNRIKWQVIQPCQYTSSHSCLVLPLPPQWSSLAHCSNPEQSIIKLLRLWCPPVWHLLHQEPARREEQEQRFPRDADSRAGSGRRRPARWMGRFPGGICLFWSPKQSPRSGSPKRRDRWRQPSGDGRAPESGSNSLSDLQKWRRNLSVWVQSITTTKNV